MANKVIRVIQEDGSVIEHIIIDRGNDEFTSMPKAVWDAQQAEQDGETL